MTTNHLLQSVEPKEGHTITSRNKQFKLYFKKGIYTTSNHLTGTQFVIRNEVRRSEK